MSFLKQFLDKMQFSDCVSACDFLPQPGSNRGYSPSVLLESFICSVWCGATKFVHTELTRFDAALSRIFQWVRVPAQDAYKRFFNKFSQTDNLRVSDYFFRWIIERFEYENVTLDIDSSILTRYGVQQGAKCGYNPQKKGRASHHPLIAFVNDLRLVANFWLRSGDTGSSSNFLPFLENTLEKLASKKVSLVRLDSGFCSREIMDYMEKKPLNYIIAAKFYHPIQRLIAGNENWTFLDDGIEICEKQYQAKDWESARRMVVVRQKISVRPQAPGKILSLFPEEEIHRNYRHSAYFTNMELAPAEVWRMYCPRGDAELGLMDKSDAIFLQICSSGQK